MRSQTSALTAADCSFSDRGLRASSTCPAVRSAVRPRLRSRLAELEETLAADGLTPIGEPIWARYDLPWTPWFRRRNEVLVAVDDQAGPAS